MKDNTSKAIMRVLDGEKRLDKDALNKLFLKQLDNVYCIKQHLLSVLPKLATKATFTDLKEAILQSTDQIKLQVLRMDVIYKMYQTVYEEHDCFGIKTFSLEGYINANEENQSNIERDLSLLIHLQITESVEMAYFSVLRNIAASIDNDDVEILLAENFDSATNCKKLYDLIAKEYIS